MRARRISMLTGLALAVLTTNAAIAGAQGARSGAEAPRTATAAAAEPAPVAPPAEQQFVSQAAVANMAEIQFGHLAVKKAQSDAVKKFAGELIDDHIKAQNGLLEAARGAGIQWPKALDDKHAATQKRLSALNGADFDREYIKAMLDGHREVEKALVARSTRGGRETSELTANVTEWSADTLKAVRAHLKMAEDLSIALEQGRSTRGSN